VADPPLPDPELPQPVAKAQTETPSAQNRRRIVTSILRST
jgi:hypothetical protein